MAAGYCAFSYLASFSLLDSNRIFEPAFMARLLHRCFHRLLCLKSFGEVDQGATYSWKDVKETDVQLNWLSPSKHGPNPGGSVSSRTTSCYRCGRWPLEDTGVRKQLSLVDSSGCKRFGDVSGREAIPNLVHIYGLTTVFGGHPATSNLPPRPSLDARPQRQKSTQICEPRLSSSAPEVL